MAKKTPHYFREKYERTCDSLRAEMTKVSIDRKILAFLNFVPADDADWSLAKTHWLELDALLTDFIGDLGSIKGNTAATWALLLRCRIRELIKIIPHETIPTT